ncbi:LacI family DNA-binding transcriptional regulator [Microbacterium sp. MPKO10]|uniref:LacI family DNA-binding transcriptional regulator n=1 Tax=Microbacterium sp. MPKO10 TaxID=2989818 RepID=UPI002236AFC2|nr:LacI family DNA-binding transcriptional regulator [Microbacterium sp. MPKO10]MCW4456658.1 LacI family transcriptional regulator [Microbacterium sp. MPKO10]
MVVADDGKNRPVTIFDVARLAGVSHQTVSRVLNDLPNVRASTRERVEKAIAQLRYTPSQAARALVTRRSRTLGLIQTGGPDYGPSSTLLYFNEAAREARYAVSIASMLEADAGALRSAAELLLRQNVEALVLIAATASDVASLAHEELGVPLIVVAPHAEGRAASVAIDHYAGARTAVAHLAELGHSDIRHVSGPAQSLEARERIRGWRDELSARGLVANEILTGDWSPASGYQYGRSLGESTATAAFVANDQMALGVIHGLRDSGREVPADFSIVGFDDIPEAAHFSPPLSTVRQDFVSLGHDVMAMVLAQLDDEAAAPRAAIVPDLVERDSTRRVPHP